MSEALLIVVIINALGFFGLSVKAYFDYKGKKEITRKANMTQKVKLSSNPNNPHIYCLSGERLATLEQAFKDMRDDIKTLFRKMNGMRR